MGQRAESLALTQWPRLGGSFSSRRLLPLMMACSAVKVSAPSASGWTGGGELDLQAVGDFADRQRARGLGEEAGFGDLSASGDVELTIINGCADLNMAKPSWCLAVMMR